MPAIVPHPGRGATVRGRALPRNRRHPHPLTTGELAAPRRRPNVAAVLRLTSWASREGVRSQAHGRRRSSGRSRPGLSRAPRRGSRRVASSRATRSPPRRAWPGVTPSRRIQTLHWEESCASPDSRSPARSRSSSAPLGPGLRTRVALALSGATARGRPLPTTEAKCARAGARNRRSSSATEPRRPRAGTFGRERRRTGSIL